MSNPNDIVIIGGGISGAATAYHLAKSGYNVTIYEKNQDLALEGSGNYQGLLYGTFHGNYTNLTELHFLGFLHSKKLIEDLLIPEVDYTNSGYIQLFATQIERDKKYQAIQKNIKTFKENLPENKLKLDVEILDDFCYLIEQKDLEKHTTLQINAKYGLFFPHSLCLEPPKLVKKLAARPNIKVIYNTEIEKINLEGGVASYKWQLFTQDGMIAEPKYLVICNASNADKFTYTRQLNLIKTLGQTTKIPAHHSSFVAICKDAYLLPVHNGYFTIGATFQPCCENQGELLDTTSDCLKLPDYQSRDTDNILNIEAIANFCPEIESLVSPETKLIGHAAIRSSSYDYLPLVGPVPRYDQFMQVFAKRKFDKNIKINEPTPYLPGLFINAAHGSKGFTTALVAGEIIRSYIANEEFCCDDKLRNALLPERVYLKQILKN